MEKGKEVTVSLVGAGAGSELSPDAGPAAPKKKRNCRIVKFVAAAAVLVLILYLLFGGDPDYGKCDLFKGGWVLNPSGPSYSNTTCRFIDDADNCLMNGRPDTQYLYWRWKPYNCDLPPFDPVVFANAMRDKSWALIGDSILRNQMQSLVCLLSKVDEPVEIYHDKAYKSRTVYFPKHNLTIATIYVPFLVKYAVNGNDNSNDIKGIQLYLDVLESKWTADYHKYDFVVITGGQWFLKSTVMWENGKVIGCHNCDKENVKEIGVYGPYHKALRLAFDFITSSDHKPLVFFRTWNPDHFEYGKWYNGGVCNRTEPYKEGQFNGSPNDHSMRKVELDEYKRARAVASKRGIQIELLDIFHLSLLRPDGHPGPYRTFHPFDKDKSAKVQNDCLHWCLPGPVDTWNELMMKILLNLGALNSSASFQQAVQGLEIMSSM